MAPPIVTNASRPRPVIPGQRFPNVTIVSMLTFYSGLYQPCESDI